MTELYSRREFSKTIGLVVLGLSSGSNSVDMSPVSSEEQKIRQYIYDWNERVGLIKRGMGEEVVYKGPLIAVGETHRGGDTIYGGLHKIVEKSGAKAVGFETLQYGDLAVDSFNRGLVTPLQMSRHSLGLGGEMNVLFFQYLRDKGIRLYGLEPLKIGSKEWKEDKLAEYRFRSMVDNVVRMVDLEGRAVAFTGYGHTGHKINRFFAPYWAAKNGVWVDLTSTDATRDLVNLERRIYDKKLQKCHEGKDEPCPDKSFEFIFQDPKKFTIEGRFGSDATTVFLTSPKDIQVIIEEFIRGLTGNHLGGSIQSDINRLRASVSSLMQLVPFESRVDNYGIIIRI